MKFRIIKTIYFLCLIICAILGFLFYQIYFKTFKIDDFSINSGDSFQYILDKAGLEQSIYIRILMRIENHSTNIKPGRYIFEDKKTLSSFFSMLVSGQSEIVRITIPEGYTLNQIQNLLTNNGLIKRESFLEILTQIDFEYYTPNNIFEGYFYPDTYNFYKGMPEYEIIKKFLNRFKREFPPENYPDKKDFYNKLILASIIEKEVFYREELPIVASVFYNRLAKGQRLESCSTIAYLFDYEIDIVTKKELQIDSDFNTYRRDGLPPTPISNPGRDAIFAAFNPAETDYFFFILEENKRHKFSNTYNEHLKIKNRIGEK